jgi:hypothetical protein
MSEEGNSRIPGDSCYPCLQAYDYLDAGNERFNTAPLPEACGGDGGETMGGGNITAAGWWNLMESRAVSRIEGTRLVVAYLGARLSDDLAQVGMIEMARQVVLEASSVWLRVMSCGCCRLLCHTSPCLSSGYVRMHISERIVLCPRDEARSSMNQ